jgi:hypothetical protein
MLRTSADRATELSSRAAAPKVALGSAKKARAKPPHRGSSSKAETADGAKAPKTTGNTALENIESGTSSLVQRVTIHEAAASEPDADTNTVAETTPTNEADLLEAAAKKARLLAKTALRLGVSVEGPWSCPLCTKEFSKLPGYQVACFFFHN